MQLRTEILIFSILILHAKLLYKFKQFLTFFFFLVSDPFWMFLFFHNSSIHYCFQLWNIHQCCESLNRHNVLFKSCWHFFKRSLQAAVTTFFFSKITNPFCYRKKKQQERKKGKNEQQAAWHTFNVQKIPRGHDLLLRRT